ncbi:hypothetical protein [Anoxybacillus flavithermus]|uniref:Uncharacterized conserved protein n=1 Tax=Anoxybacillus flavithermus (strain DSM 21510 / WK1) TaxID=491915 RepID=B7GFX1_ANOFW|nr:hypothetical protein [Anoxybacillus flavithermus]ACJ32650.1 Uncharacterized conserved protein [Anoxybacillus flavithermus WK1]
MVESLLYDMLHEVKVPRKKVESMEKRVDSLEKEVSSLRQQVQALDEKVQALDEKMQRLDERTLETKAICEAVRHGQEALIAKYDALALDVHNMQGNINRLTNISEEKSFNSS